ncbi:MAG TPA: tetratricopeptide repeat protein [Pyrinomonadaceae bacterium]|jgi:tetratricopeptide (TPR) repeat protein
MNKPTDFEIELERIDRDLAELEESALSVPFDSQQATKFAYRLYQRASLTGDLRELALAERAINRAIRRVSNAADLYFLKASLDFKLHRVADARRHLSMVEGLRESLQGRALEADLDFQEGRYKKARKEYEDIIREERTWDNLARLAHFEARMGDPASAERLYLEAEDEITAKEMRSLAWVELQRGLLHLMHGRYDEASTHYQRAERAYSGYWLVDEHVAELLGAQGKYEEAVALYQKVVARVPKPELQQALGELCTLMDEPAQAERWFEKALAAYLESAAQGGVHYYHHLVDFYADVRRDGREAVNWARKDVSLRENFSTQAALAWALYRDGQLDEALARINQALSSGVKDAHIFSQAATIHRALGASDQGDRYLQMAAEINPHHRNFHVHH